MFYYLVAFVIFGGLLGLIAENCINQMDYCPVSQETAICLNKNSMHIYILTAVGAALIGLLDIRYSYEYRHRRPAV